VFGEPGVKMYLPDESLANIFFLLFGDQESRQNDKTAVDPQTHSGFLRKNRRKYFLGIGWKKEKNNR
jgi:hypothetical protein